MEHYGAFRFSLNHKGQQESTQEFREDQRRTKTSASQAIAPAHASPALHLKLVGKHIRGKMCVAEVIVTTFEIAHINEQGVNVVVVFVDGAFARKSAEEQNEIAASLQACARSANLAGNVAMVWPGEFWAPSNQHAFFRSPGGSHTHLQMRINKTLSCG